METAVAKFKINLAALQKFEELTGKTFKEVDVILTGGNYSASDMISLLIAMRYGAEFPEGDLEEIRLEVLSYDPSEISGFFMRLQQEEGTQPAQDQQ